MGEVWTEELVGNTFDTNRNMTYTPATQNTYSFIHPFIHPLIHQWLYCPMLGPGTLLQFHNLITQRVGLLE
jgi:hypothetical protein